MSPVPATAGTVNNIRAACVERGYRSGVCRMGTESTVAFDEVHTTSPASVSRVAVHKAALTLCARR